MENIDILDEFDESSSSKVVEIAGVKFKLSSDGKTVIECLSKDVVEITSFPEEVEFIGEKAFSNCLNLEEVKLPPNLKSIGDYAFKSCGELKTIELPSSLRFIGTGAFMKSGLSSVKIPSDVEEVGLFAFRECSNLKKVDIPSTVDIFINNVFSSVNDVIVKYGDVNFTINNGVISQDSIRYNESVKDIYDRLIESEILLESYVRRLYFPGAKGNTFDELLKDYIINNDSLPKLFKTLLIEPNSEELKNLEYRLAYQALDEATSKEVEINGVKFKLSIDGKEIIECLSKDVVEITSFPEGVESIGEKSFSNCLKLDKVELPPNLKSIGDCAFELCIKLKNIKLSETLENIGDYAFKSCGELKTIELPSSLRFIGTGAFMKSGLSSVKIPYEINDVGYSAFSNCSNLINVEVPLSVDFFSKHIFSIENGLKVKYGSIFLDINNGIISIGYKKSAEDIYDYLVKQKILPESVMRELYFPGANGNTFAELLNDYFNKNKSLPKLFKTLLVEPNDKNKIELRDRLVYVSTMKLLDGNYNNNYGEAIKFLENNLFDSIVFSDFNELSPFVDGIAENIILRYPEFIGIMKPLKDKLDGIDISWFGKLYEEMSFNSGNRGVDLRDDDDNLFKRFYKSLETKKEWDDSCNDIKKLTYLKNEIVAKLLYSSLVIGRNADFKDILEYASKSNKQLYFPINEYGRNAFDPIRINKMLEIDPYSFDGLRGVFNENTEAVFARNAASSGYMFTDGEIVKYNINSHPNYFEAITNSVGMAKIPSEYMVSYLEHLKSIKDSMSGNFSEDKLFNFCRAFDFYLRNNNQYYVNGEESEEVARRVFDVGNEFSSSDRILYCLYNLNKIAHNTSELNAIAAYKNRFRSEIVEEKESVEKKLSYAERVKSIFSAYNTLDKCGYKELLNIGDDGLLIKLSDDKKYLIKVILEEKIDNISPSLFSAGDVREKLEKLLKLDFKTINDEDVKNELKVIKTLLSISDDEAKYLIKVILEEKIDNISPSLFSAGDVREKLEKLDFKTINDEDVKNELKAIKTLLSISDDEYKILSSGIKEQQVFFECKRWFSEEIMKRIASEFGDNFKEMLGANLEDKQKFYAKHGYIAEVQDTKDGPTLVCLCEKFREPFSVHLKDLPDDIADALRVVKRTETIAHGSLNGKGLSLRDNAYKSDVASITEDTYVGFKVTSGLEFLPAAMKSNYQNYDVPAKKIREDMARDSSRSELGSMFSESTNSVDSANINTGGNKHQ